jgi:hypothetical protein
VGWKKKDSDHKLRVRLEKKREERETLLPCPVCEASGGISIVSATQYRHRLCHWCDGTGAVSHEMLAVYRRWERIRAVNRVAGRCAK